MFRATHRRRPDRRGAILLVVLAMLTLMAVIGLTFVMRAESAATAARLGRESATRTTSPAPDATEFLNFGMAQLIYDVPDGTVYDVTGGSATAPGTTIPLIASALRGHSLARTAFGYQWNSRGQGIPPANLSLFSGFGRFPEPLPPGSVPGVPGPVDRAGVINFSLYRDDGNPGPGAPYDYVFDPEWNQLRTRLAANQYGSPADFFRFRPGERSGGMTPYPYETRTYTSVAAPYTYPDLKDLYLAVVSPTTGEILQPSFHRTFSAFGPLGNPLNNPHWWNQEGRLYLLRPRPGDHLTRQEIFDALTSVGTQPNLAHALPAAPTPQQIGALMAKVNEVGAFPLPAPNADGSVTGDVQNFRHPQGVQKNDAVWLYPAGPVREWNGKKYTGLLAFTVIDLNGRVNLSVAGNRTQPTTDAPTPNDYTHGSAYGATQSEINPRWVLDPTMTDATSYATDANKTAAAMEHLLRNNAPPTFQPFAAPTGPIQVAGRYNGGTVPPNDRITGTNAAVFNGGIVPPHYSRTDVNASRTIPPPMTPLTPDRADTAGVGTSPFPAYPPSRYYDAAAQAAEFANHPAQSGPDYWNAATWAGPTNGGRTFGTTNGLLPRSDARWLNSTYGLFPDRYVRSDAAKLLPRHLGSGTYANATQPFVPGYPAGSNPQFTTVDPANLVRVLTTTDSSTIWRPEATVNATGIAPPAMPLPSPPAPANALVTARLGPTDLNRSLPDYRADTSRMLGPDNMGNWSAAQRARQMLARDIFVRLVAAAQPALLDGTNAVYVSAPGQPDDGYIRVATVPTAAPAATMSLLRQYAQVAVNIVDYIDPDDVATTFTWNPSAGVTVDPATGLPAVGTITPGPTTNLGNHVVYGTEAPRLVLNEAYAEVGNHEGDYNPSKGKANPPAVGLQKKTPAEQPFQKRVWVEVFNPMRADDVLSERGLARLSYPTGVFGAGTTFAPYSPYQIAVAVPKAAGNPPTSVDDAANVTGRPGADLEVQLQVDKYDYDPSQTPAHATTQAEITAYPPTASAVPSTPATNIEQYVVQPHSGAGPGASQTNQNGFAMLGPPTEFPEQDPVKPGFVGATIRIKEQPSALDPNIPSALNLNLNTKDSTKLTPADLLRPNYIYLRRLANPYLPPNDPSDPAFPKPGLPINPYITVDRMEGVPTNDNVRFDQNDKRNPPVAEKDQASVGRAHPFGAALQAAQTTAPSATAPKSTFFSHNDNVAKDMAGSPRPFEWLTHLDRQLLNTLEVVSVNAYAPTRVTQQFAVAAGQYNRHTAESAFVPGLTNGAAAFGLFTLVPPSTPDPLAPGQVRAGFLHPALDLFAVRPPYTGVPVGGRVRGQVNLNTTWHDAILRAVLDPRGAADPMRANFFTDADVGQQGVGMWGQLTQAGMGNDYARSKGFPDVTGTDRPFRGLLGSADPMNATATDPHNNTVLRRQNGSTALMFGSPNAGGNGASDPTHAWAVTDPLRKMWNNTTTVSNNFLVIVTVGFFEVRDPDGAGPLPAGPDANGRVYLGRELFQSVPGDLRQKYVAVVDRTGLAVELNGTTVPTGVQAEDEKKTPETPNEARARIPAFATLAEDVQPGATEIKVVARTDNPTNSPLQPTTAHVFAGGDRVDLTGRRLHIGYGNAALNQSDGEVVQTWWLPVPKPTAAPPTPPYKPYPPVSDPDPTDHQVVFWQNGVATMALTTPVQRFHPAGSPVSNILLGNPGPQPAFDHAAPRYQMVVPFLTRVAPGE